MEELQDKLNAILSNPQMMAQLMSMAQSFGQSQPPQSEPPTPQPVSSAAFPGSIDPAIIQKVINFAQKTGIDKNQQSLLSALKPYLSRDRIDKLEKAMRAARLASAATTLLGNQNNPFFSGR